MSKPLSCVITTIQRPTVAVVALAARLADNAARMIVIGDVKGPEEFRLENVDFYPLDAQFELSLNLAARLPTGSYARKNLGYLLAMEQGAGCIYETDDDNAPLPNWSVREPGVHAHVVGYGGWVNIFRAFTDDTIWPRGFPLSEVVPSFSRRIELPDVVQRVYAPVQQGLAAGAPDVDAVWRLTRDQTVTFQEGSSLYLKPGAWCPFNSQSTWWWPEAYVLLYLPSHCPFRMTDIWRGFVAQRCLWAIGRGLVFHAPEVQQSRNIHDLMRDFSDEVPGYLQNSAIARILDDTDLAAGIEHLGDNLLTCYKRLVAKRIFPEEEIELVLAWLADWENVSLPVGPDR